MFIISEFCKSLLDILRHQGACAALAFMMAWLRARYHRKGFYRSLLDALMCAMLGGVAHQLLQFLGLTADYSWLASVVIGYLGVDHIGSWLKKKTGKL
ncbi:phage holin, lambda family [Candidatus Williamhamiltonella defendens]|uniref:Phage holin, lambda family n=1 Tax=Candidatus Hamiltonella defensa (Bemisia tabaci) TaxID=672795 RepID=A0A249DX52_9ENTR|nr:phage holin, lambda family [Candidatus Hamiltonella defensa]ACJ10110.1 lambda-like group I holin [Bacteriophage APSE-7]ASX26124.1 phage holin, lambda family [Candidatus Hamiltonella defensa (Bemisia tabaci)]CED78236.1 APSE-2 prophage Lambda-like group I holin [Candidatus Hamiltonella defensa (Bemisia tabaci)]